MIDQSIVRLSTDQRRPDPSGLPSPFSSVYRKIVLSAIVGLSLPIILPFQISGYTAREPRVPNSTRVSKWRVVATNQRRHTVSGEHTSSYCLDDGISLSYSSYKNMRKGQARLGSFKFKLQCTQYDHSKKVVWLIN